MMGQRHLKEKRKRKKLEVKLSKRRLNLLDNVKTHLLIYTSRLHMLMINSTLDIDEGKAQKASFRVIRDNRRDGEDCERSSDLCG